MPENNNQTPQSAQAPKILTSKAYKFLPALMVMLTSVMPIFFLFAQNAYNITLGEILLPMAVAAVFGLAVYFIVLLVFRNNSLSGLFAALCMFLFMNFNLVLYVSKKVAPTRPVIIGYAIAAAVALAVLVVLILLRKKKLLLRTLVCVLSAVLAVQVLANTITAIPASYRRIKASHAYGDSAPADNEQTLPNIYYLVVDEYFDFDLIKSYYGYDNSEFYNFLVEKGFNVSTTSYNNGISTSVNLADILSLDYVAEGLSDKEAQSIIANGKLFDILQQQGYTTKSASSIQKFYPIEPLYELNRFAFQAGSATTDGTGTLELIIKNTMLNPYSEIILLTLSKGYSPVVEVFDYLQNDYDYATDGNNAIFMYVCAPHVPFQLNADGSLQPMVNWSNWSDPECYLQQFEYVTDQLQATINKIIEEDPGSIIVLQSDHGVRYHTDCLLVHQFYIEPEDERRILNAVYYCGQELDIDGASGVNTWRRVLSELGLYYPDVEVPNPITIVPPEDTEQSAG